MEYYTPSFKEVKMAHLDSSREEDETGIQSTTNSKYDLRDRVYKMEHKDLADHVLGVCDDDCPICDMGQSGQFIDDDEEEERSSKDDVDTEGERAVRESKGDKHNLMKHGEHTSKHPGFSAIQKRIAEKSGVSQKAAGAILAARSRSASRGAHRANPRLNRVKG